MQIGRKTDRATNRRQCKEAVMAPEKKCWRGSAAKVPTLSGVKEV